LPGLAREFTIGPVKQHRQNEDDTADMGPYGSADRETGRSSDASDQAQGRQLIGRDVGGRNPSHSRTYDPVDQRIMTDDFLLDGVLIDAINPYSHLKRAEHTIVRIA
jgi:hypothetical protein